MPQYIDVSPTWSNTSATDKNHSVGGRMLAIACSPDGQKLYAGSYSNLWTSEDGGQNWWQGLDQPSGGPDFFRFDVSHDLGGWCVVDIAVALGWRTDRHPRFVVPLARRGHPAIVGFGDCGVWTALGNGDGSFQNPNVVLNNFGYQAGGWQIDKHPRFLADLSGDGRADIVGFGDAGVWTALGNGDGTFKQANFVLANFGYQAGGWQVDKHPRFLADLSGNGRADIVGFGDAGVWTALGNGDGTFQQANFVLANFGYQAGSWHVDKHPRFLADLSGNGRADIVGFGDAGVWVALSNGDGTFQQASFALDNFGYDQGWRVDKHPRFLADLTGDGRADIIGFGDAGVWIALGNGDGTFQPASFVLANFGYDQDWRVDLNARFVVDLTGDGRPDIAGFGNAGVWTALANGDGTFQNPRLVLPLTDPHFLDMSQIVRLFADLNGDGCGDIVEFGGDGVWTELSKGDGTFGNENVLANFGSIGTLLALTRNDFLAGSHGIWRSTDGGANWVQSHQFPPGNSGGQLEWALGSDHLVYAAGGSSLAVSRNAGASFEDAFPWGRAAPQRVNHIALWQNQPADSTPAVIYALSDSGMSLSFDGGTTWMPDLGTLPSNVGAATSTTANGNTSKVFVISPRWPLEVFVAGNGSGGAMAPALWRGDYSSFPFGSQTSSWDSVPLPDMGEQDSGNVFLVTTQKFRGDLLFFGAQRSRAFVGPLYPSSGSDWAALDGNVHVDLHGLLLSPDFAAGIRNGDYKPATGTVWLMSDGGIYRSTNGGRNFSRVNGVTTLSCLSVAGVAVRGTAPALSLNSGDNDGFYSMDGGQHWSYQQYGGGDNDCAFSDPLRPETMLVFTPRWDSAANSSSGRNGQTVSVYVAPHGHLADARLGTNQRRAVTGPPVLPPSAPSRPIWNASSFYGLRGFRPIVLGLAGESAPVEGDYIFILFGDLQSVLVRTQNILDIVHRVEWLTSATGPGQGANVFQQGPPLPQQDIGIVQASGGHAATIFYAGGDASFGLWTWTQGMASWRRILPGPGATHAYRFFVDPYRPNLIYILDDGQVKRSDDGGNTWQTDTNLRDRLTWGGQIPVSSNDDSSGLGDHLDLVLTDMKFDPNNPQMRFAIGLGGAYFTSDGVNWTMVARSSMSWGALRPASCYYDWVSDPSDPALYVAFAGRSIVKISRLSDPNISVISLATPRRSDKPPDQKRT